MFFLFVLKEMGFPISEAFEKEIKDVPTARFSKDFDDEYKDIYAELKKERHERLREEHLKRIHGDGFGVDREKVLMQDLALSERHYLS